MLLKGGKILEVENTIICLFQITILKSDCEQDLFFWKCYLFLSGKAKKNLKPLFHKISLETITQAYHNSLTKVLWEYL